MAGDDLSLLLKELYAGIGDESRLTGFMRLAAPLLGSHTAGISIRQDVARPGSTLAMAGAKASDEVRRRYDDTYIVADDNHWFHRARPRLRRGGLLISDELASTSEMKRTRYYADFLSDLDTLHSLALCVDVRPKRAVILSFCRSERAGAYEAAHVELGRLLGPHIAHAYGLMEERKRLLRSADLRFLHVELDASLRVLGSSAQTDALVTAGGLRMGRDRTLHACSVQTQVQWAAHCKARLADPCAPLAPVPIYARDGSLLALMSLDQTGLFNDETPVKYVCRVRVLRTSDRADHAAMLSTMFGLSTAEARLAGVLYETRDLTEAAAQLAITRGTARTRLASVFQKTGTHKQAALLALLDALADCHPLLD